MNEKTLKEFANVKNIRQRLRRYKASNSFYPGLLQPWVKLANAFGRSTYFSGADAEGGLLMRPQSDGVVPIRSTSRPP